MASKQDIIKMMMVIGKAYPNYATKEGADEVYFMILGDVPRDALEAGAKAYLATGNPFFPSPGQWRQHALDIVVNKIGIPSEYEAWEEAMRHCRAGHYTDYSHPMIERAVKVIGIPYWQAMLIDEEMATRAHFFRVYADLCNRALDDVKQLPAVRTVQERYQVQAGDMIKQLAQSKGV